jgi:hypothetical protein
MKTDDPNLKPLYRMPRVFGNLPGPRNVPEDKRHLPNNQTNIVIAVTALTDRALLQELCPPGCEVDGEPLVTMSQNFMTNIGWLAGHGYSIVNVSFPIVYQSISQGPLRGNFTPVLWENLADPILTGREELGFSKIFAEMPPPRILGNSYSGLASWQGFRFFEIETHDLEEAPTSVPPSTIGAFHYKFIPKTGQQGEPDVEYLEYAPPGLVTGYGGLKITRRLTGKGSFKFHHARWEDLPFQYPIVNTLAALPVHEIRAASASHLAASGAIGDPSEGALKQID